MTNLYAQVVKRLSPRNCPALAMMATTASAVAWWARSSSSGPEIRSWPPRRASSARATRRSDACSRAAASSRPAPHALSARTHSADSASGARAPSPARSAGGSTVMIPKLARALTARPGPSAGPGRSPASRHMAAGSPVARVTEVLEQVDAVVPVRVARRAAAFGIPEPGVEAGRLEGVSVQGDPVTAAALDLGLGGGQEPGPQAVTALVAPDPEQLDIAAPAPRPPVQPRVQLTIVPAGREGQQAGVVVAGGGGVEGADLLIKPFPQAGIALARDERHLTHDCLPPGVLDGNGTRIEQVEALALRVLLRLRSWLGDDDGHIAAAAIPSHSASMSISRGNSSCHGTPCP